MEKGIQIIKSIDSTNLTLEKVEIGLNTIERMHHKSLKFNWHVNKSSSKFIKWISNLMH